ncbi:MAG: hypothetical protein PHP19_09725 [Firmicutes bacterium]|nr:hypothetical protein [Bacillota bacterium]
MAIGYNFPGKNRGFYLIITAVAGFALIVLSIAKDTMQELLAHAAG